MCHVAWSAVSCVRLTPADFLGCGRGLSSIQHISYPALGQLYFPLCGFVSDVRLSDTIIKMSSLGLATELVDW